jgi:hypothetical protein
LGPLPDDVASLPRARVRHSFDLGDSDRFHLYIAAVATQIGDATVRMLACSGSIPGPTLRCGGDPNW